MLVPVKGIKRYQSDGKWYCYHRKTGARIEAEPGTAAFVVEIAQLDAKVIKRPAGTLNAAIDAYLASRFYKHLAPRTREGYQRAISEIRTFGKLPLAKITTPGIIATQEDVLARKGLWLANYYVAVLSLILKHARRLGWMTTDPTKDVEKIRLGRKKLANREWTPAECRAVLDAAPPYLAVPIGLAMFAGLRKADVLTLEWSALQNGVIVRETKKTGALVAVPLHPTLRNILSVAPPGRGHRMMACNSRGLAWTSSGYDSTFGKMIDRLERAGKVAIGLTMHGLRHNLGTRLREAGVKPEDRKKLLGHISDAMGEHYSRNAELTADVVAIFQSLPIAGEAEAPRQIGRKSLIRDVT